MSIDDLRRLYPGLGYAVYAYSPGEPVILEVIDGAETFTWTGTSLAACIAAAFPPRTEHVIGPYGPAEVDVPEAPQPSIFD